MNPACRFRVVLEFCRRFPKNRDDPTTGDMETVAQLLGHASIDCSQRYVDVDLATLEDMFANAL